MTAIRNEPFIPLTTTAPTPGAKEFHARVVSRAADAPPVAPPEAAGAAPAKTPRDPHAACEPRVAVQRDGDHVSGIRIECSCGQVIDLACVYQDPPRQG